MQLFIHSRQRLGIVGIVAALVVGVIFPHCVFAQRVSTDRKQGLTLAPLRKESEIYPGTSLDGYITVSNYSSAPMDVDLSAAEFRMTDQQYDYAFTDDSEVAKWVQFESRHVTLAVKESKNIKYTIGVPLTAEPGGRYISIFASNTGDKNDGINTEQRVASLLYVTVMGNVTRAGSLLSLSLPWLASGTTEWSMNIRDSGTTHFRSNYEGTVNDIFTNLPRTRTTGSALILPGTVREIRGDIAMPLLPGIYKYIYTIGLGDTPARQEVCYVVYIPTWAQALLGIVVFASLVIVGLRQIKRSHSQATRR